MAKLKIRVETAGFKPCNHPAQLLHLEWQQIIEHTQEESHREARPCV